MMPQSLLQDAEDDDAHHEDPTATMRFSIERFSHHIPVCIARFLEDNPMDASNIPGGQKEKSIEEDNPQSSAFARRVSWGAFAPLKRSSGSFYNSACSFDSSSQSLFTISSADSYTIPVFSENSYHRAALLLVDISGFTRLSTLLDVESLSNAINTYFELLIKQVEKFGGDVLKFAGDAFFAEWREEDEGDDDDLEEAVQMAAYCGWSIVKNYSGYEVPGLSSEVALLDVHCGVGVGKLATLHVGDNETRREVLFLGDPIDQVSAAEDLAENGQVAASPEAIEILKETCTFAGCISPPSGPQVITSFDEGCLESIPSGPYQLTYFSPNIIRSLSHQMSLYVHETARVDADDIQGGSHSRRGIADAEIRRVYTIFVKPILTPKITGDRLCDQQLFLLLNNIMMVAMKILKRFKGHLRQFIVDDKGVVLIATFGQRGATFPNLITEKGLPATIAIHDAMKNNLDIDNHIGATFGKAYCGVVGGVHRHEFAVLGPSVNLAARLMCSENNPGILVDDTIRMMASKRFDFSLHPPVIAKGYSKPVPIFEPQSSIERQWNKVTNFVGREAEIDKLVSLGKRFYQNRCKAKAQMVLIQAHSGLGKSSLAMEAMDRMRRLGRSYGKEVAIKKNICKDGEEHVPFCVFRQIFLQLISEHAEIDDDDSLSMSGIEDDGTIASEENQRKCIRKLCVQLKYSVEFADQICEKMLGMTTLFNEDSGNSGKQMTPNDLLNVVVDMFFECTKQHDYTLLAIDDVHWMDSLSWKVIERLHQDGRNLMIFCISRPLTGGIELIDREFLNKLRSAANDGDSPQFTEINLTPFAKNDVRDLLALSFACEPGSIDDEVCDYLYEQTGGMPYFAEEVVGNIIRNDLLEIKDDGSVGWRSGLSVAAKKVLYANVNDLLLHRLDSFKSEARTLLQVCAVLGFEFSLSELLNVQCRVQRKKKQIRRIQNVLQKACVERILMESYPGGRSNKEKVVDIKSNEISKNENSEGYEIQERSYRFSHAIWRNCVLGTMLRERKRDLHRIIATIMETDGPDEIVDIRVAIKLFGHLKASGQLMKATKLAQKIGKYLDDMLLHRQSIEFCLEALEMWKDESGSAESTDLVAGINPTALNSITPGDVECLARIHIAVAKDYINLGDAVNGCNFYQKCDLILTKSSAANDLKDRTVFFALYSGYFAVVQSGGAAVNANDKTVLQTDLAHSFVEQARIHGDPVHLARALAMESLALGGLGRFEEAISVQEQLEEIYSAKDLSEGIIRTYCTDRAAQNFGYSVLWYEVLGRHEKAQRQIDFILEELIHAMPPKNVHNSIMILLPVMTVLKEQGRARKAESIFLTHVYDCFYKYFDEDSTTFFKSIYIPWKSLLRLASDLQEEQNGKLVYKDGNHKEIEDWVLSDKVGNEDKNRTLPMCALGRDLHCIIAEICWCLAVLIKRNQRVGNDDETRIRKLLKKGREQADLSMSYTQRSPGYEYAHRLSIDLMQKFEHANFEVCNKQIPTT